MAEYVNILPLFTEIEKNNCFSIVLSCTTWLFFNGFMVYSRLNFKFYDVVFLFFCLNLLLFEYTRFLSFLIF